MNVKIAESDAELDKVIPVLLQLRVGFDRSALLARIEQQMRNGYQLAYVEADGEV